MIVHNWLLLFKEWNRVELTNRYVIINNLAGSGEFISNGLEHSSAKTWRYGHVEKSLVPEKPLACNYQAAVKPVLNKLEITCISASTRLTTRSVLPDRLNHSLPKDIPYKLQIQNQLRFPTMTHRADGNSTRETRTSSCLQQDTFTRLVRVAKPKWGQQLYRNKRHF